jgi:hypothetical protein
MNKVKLLVSSALVVLTLSTPQAVHSSERAEEGANPLPAAICHEIFNLSEHEDLRRTFNNETFIPGGNFTTPADLERFLFFVNNSPLTTLDLRTKWIGDAGAQVMAKALAENIVLQELRLSGVSIGDTGIQAITEMLETNTTLTTLEMRGAHIEIAGAKAIAEMLETNTTLTTLDLRGSSIDAEGLQAIVYVLLQENNTLTTLNLENINIGARESQAIREILALRPIKPGLRLGGNRR